MSKVNVDEIKVGDLVETMYGQERWLCYVTRLDVKNKRYKGFWSDNFKEEWDHMDDLTGHWKVINFEEESKVEYVVDMPLDELKVYTGKETLQAFLEGKVLKRLTNNTEYKIEDKSLLWKSNGSWITSRLDFCELMSLGFTEVATPQVGDWVRVTHSVTNALMATGEVTEVISNAIRIHGRLFSIDYNFEILSPEQVSEYKREQAFVKVGRKLNEFKANDIVFVNSLGITAIVISNSNNQEVRLHQINHGAKGYTAKPHQLRPISFVEQQVDFS